MLRHRAPWLVTVLAVLVVAIVPPLRQQAQLQWLMGRWPVLPSVDAAMAPSLTDGEMDPCRWLSRPMWLYRRDCVDFAMRHYPEDAGMLLGAGELAQRVAFWAGIYGLSGLAWSLDDESSQIWTQAAEQYEQHSRIALERAMELSDAPAVLAAYALSLSTGGYARPGGWGADGADLVSIAEAEREIAESGLPTRLSDAAAAPVLDALRRWREADPDNGLPVALEAHTLYGLHRDAAALAHWEEAAARREFTARRDQAVTAAKRTLQHMGLRSPEADLFAQDVSPDMAAGRVGGMVRIAVFEGERAASDGRSRDAVRIWETTRDVADLAQRSSTRVDLLASAYEGMAASPIWEWHPDSLTGTTGGPLQNGRLWRGPHYEIYVKELGEEAAASLRDRVIRARTRHWLLLDGGIDWLLDADEIALTGYALFLGRIIAQQFVLAAALLAVVVVGLRRHPRRAGGTRSRVLVPCLAALLIPVAGIVTGLGFPKAAFLSQGLVNAAVAFPIALVVLASLNAVQQERGQRGMILAGWTVRVREFLPTTVALLATAYLAVGVVTAGMRVGLARDCLASERGELQHAAGQLGAAWTDPVIPQDAWRDERPPVPRP